MTRGIARLHTKIRAWRLGWERPEGFRIGFISMSASRRAIQGKRFWVVHLVVFCNNLSLSLQANHALATISLDQAGCLCSLLFLIKISCTLLQLVQAQSAAFLFIQVLVFPERSVFESYLIDCCEYRRPKYGLINSNLLQIYHRSVMLFIG